MYKSKDVFKTTGEERETNKEKSKQPTTQKILIIAMSDFMY